MGSTPSVAVRPRREPHRLAIGYLGNPAECYYPVKLKPGLRPGTGMDMVKRLEALEDRVHHYETRLADQEARLTQVALQSQPMPVQTPGLSLPAGLSSTLSDLPSAGLPDLVGPPSGGPIDLSSFGPSASPGNLSTTSFRDPQVLPPDDVVRDLIALFFTHIHPWAPILAPSLPSWSPPWSIVVHAIVVVTLRISTDPRVVASREQYKAAAKQHVVAHAIESTSISSVQALALLALDLIGSEQGPSSWGILALLTRSAVHLGLAVEEDASSFAAMVGRAPAPSLSRTSIIPPAANWHEDESRRRLFWLIFCLDRYACVSTGWDFALPDFDIKRRLPCADDLWARNEWFFAPSFKPVLHRDLVPDHSVLSPMAYLVEALDLLGRAHTLQSQIIEPGDARAVEIRKDVTMTLTSAAKRWYSDLPIREGHQSAISLMIQGIHHATLLKLNAYYAFPALSNGEPQEPYVSTCLTSARSMVALTSVARDAGWQRTSTPLFIWSCWVSARVLFVHAFLAHQLSPDEDFDSIVAALKEQAQYWGLAKQYVRLLERAKRKWLASLGDASDKNLPDAIHVLLDLRRTAYSAVKTNQQETPHVSPPDVNLSHLPAWAVQPLLGDLHNWFDLPAGLFQADTGGSSRPTRRTGGAGTEGAAYHREGGAEKL
ncbi:hypothetical protein EHS25_008481 [Saitozyma podzolica]|uniref:Xylanolytic transcriptional activator regulatory domain-containing protein n=1 Tax=Saitozyma podzolica TaxID=1890683 RepID=A0A427YLZ3_9TREE|nr:hypothetical protein EHS25_008481 [Saitozyma podzolica]